MILVVGLSSAWQRTLSFNRFLPGEVNRTSLVLETASGKGVNVARVATLLGEPACVLTLAGGHRGTLFRKALSDDGVKAKIIPMSGETRMCHTLISGKRVTEIVEESPALSPAEVEATRAAFSKLLRCASMVILSGTVPRGCGDGYFAQLAKEAGKKGVSVIADTQGNHLIQVARERPSLIKINRAELVAATGSSSVTEGVSMLMKLGAKQVVISNGSKASMAFDGRTHWLARPPRIEPVNPIGSGDAMLAGLAVGLFRGQTLESALELGLACGAANALTATSGVIKVSDVSNLMHCVKMTCP